MFATIAELVTRKGWVIILSWALAAGALWYFAPPWSSVSRDDDVRFFPAEYASVRGQGLLERGFPADTSSSSVVIIAERRGAALAEDDLRFVDRLEAEFRTLGRERPELGFKDLLTRSTPIVGDRMTATSPEGGQVALTVAQLRGTFASKEARLAVEAVLERLDALRPEAPAGLNLAVSGGAAVGHDSNTAANESVEATTIATIALVVAILLVVYRSPLLALIPLVTITLSSFTALKVIASMAVPPLNFQVIQITRIFVIVVLFGAGTDYCLFLIARYREELARGRNPSDAVGEAIRQVGGALVASAGTVIVGLGMLWFSTFAKIQYTGPSIALSLVIALVAALTLAPVLLRLLRGALFWPFKPPAHLRGADPEEEGLRETPMFGFWAGVADFVVRRPALILIVSLLALLPFAWVGMQTRSSYDVVADLGPDQPSVKGTTIFRTYYPEGELGPTTLLVRHPDVDFTTAEGVEAIEDLSVRLLAVPGVVEVRSLTRPVGKPVPMPPMPAPAPPPPEPRGRSMLGALGTLGGMVREGLERGMREQILRAYRQYVSVGEGVVLGDQRHITRLDLVLDANPFSEKALDILARVEGVLDEAAGAATLKGSEVGVSGTTVLISDLRRVVTADERRMYLLVTLGVYVILVLLLRRPGICLYLIATVVLGYLASLGATDLFFRWWLAGQGPWMGLDWKVGFFLFVILVAVGEDYNIFLMSRVIEEERKHGPIEGTRRAVAHTGGIISSCGVIMAGTFGAMLFGSLTTLKELGFALALGVLLDTFIVRPILVPAFVVLMHRSRPRMRLEAPALLPDEAAAPTAP